VAATDVLRRRVRVCTLSAQKQNTLDRNLGKIFKLASGHPDLDEAQPTGGTRRRRNDDRPERIDSKHDDRFNPRLGARGEGLLPRQRGKR